MGLAAYLVSRVLGLAAYGIGRLLRLASLLVCRLFGSAAFGDDTHVGDDGRNGHREDDEHGGQPRHEGLGGRLAQQPSAKGPFAMGA